MKIFIVLFAGFFLMGCRNTNPPKEQKITISNKCKEIHRNFEKYKKVANSTEWYLQVTDSIVKNKIQDTILCDCYLYELSRIRLGDHFIFVEEWINKAMAKKLNNHALLYKISSSVGFADPSLVLKGRFVLTTMNSKEQNALYSELKKKAFMSMYQDTLYANNYVYRLLLFQYLKHKKILTVTEELELLEKLQIYRHIHENE